MEFSIDGSGDRIVRWAEVRPLVGLSRTAVWKYEKRGLFPPLRRLGPNSFGWFWSEIEAWLRMHRDGPSSGDPNDSIQPIDAPSNDKRNLLTFERQVDK